MLSKDIKGIYEAYSKMYQSTNPSDEVIGEEIDGLVEEVIEELFEECVAEGYTIDEAAVAIEEAATEYLMELNPYAPAGSKEARSYAKSTSATKRGVERKAAVKGAVERVKAKAKGIKAAAGIAGSIAKDEARRAGRAAVQSVKSGVEKKKEQVKSGIKGFLGQAAKKVASKASSVAARLGEELEALKATGLFSESELEAFAKADLNEADSIAAMRERAAKRRQQRYGKSGGGGRDDFRPYTKADYEQGEANDPRKKVKEELEKTGLFSDNEIEAILETQMNEGIIDAAKAGSKRHQDAMKSAGRAIKKARENTQKLGKALAPAAETAKSAAGGVAKAAKATYAAGERTGAFVKKGAQRHNDMIKAAKKVFSKEELELIAQYMIDEGYDLSDFTWEEFNEFCLNNEETVAIILDESAIGTMAVLGGMAAGRAIHGKLQARKAKKELEAKRRTSDYLIMKDKTKNAIARDRSVSGDTRNEEYVDEAQYARENPEKYEREQAKKSAPVRGERTPMPPRGDKRREDFEKWYAKQMGR